MSAQPVTAIHAAARSLSPCAQIAALLRLVAFGSRPNSTLVVFTDRDVHLRATGRGELLPGRLLDELEDGGHTFPARLALATRRGVGSFELSSLGVLAASARVPMTMRGTKLAPNRSAQSEFLKRAHAFLPIAAGLVSAERCTALWALADPFDLGNERQLWRASALRSVVAAAVGADLPRRDEALASWSVPLPAFAAANQAETDLTALAFVDLERRHSLDDVEAAFAGVDQKGVSR